MSRLCAVAFVAAMISHVPAQAMEGICFPIERLNRSAEGPREVDKATAGEVLAWINARTPPPAWSGVPVLVKESADKAALYVVVLPAPGAACAFRLEGDERAQVSRILGL